jgi:hypothetical protein
MTQTELSLNTKESQAKKVLRVLKIKGRITNVELVQMHILRGSERIRELKADGYRIVTNHIKGGLWEYVFKGHEDDAREWDAGR